MLPSMASGESIAGWAKELGFDLDADAGSTTLHKGWDLGFDFRILILTLGALFSLGASIRNGDGDVVLVSFAASIVLGILTVRRYRSGTYAEGHGLVLRGEFWTR